MGNCLANEEDVGMQGVKGTAVGQSSDAITDELLSSSLAGGGLKQTVALTFSCANLPNLDSGSKTDPFLVLWQMNGKQQQRLGQTEVIADNLDPEFVKEIKVDYYFEQQQKFRVDVYDVDDNTQ